MEDPVHARTVKCGCAIQLITGPQTPSEFCHKSAAQRPADDPAGHGQSTSRPPLRSTTVHFSLGSSRTTPPAPDLLLRRAARSSVQPPIQGIHLATSTQAIHCIHPHPLERIPAGSSFTSRPNSTQRRRIASRPPFPGQRLPFNQRIIHRTEIPRSMTELAAIYSRAHSLPRCLVVHKDGCCWLNVMPATRCSLGKLACIGPFRRPGQKTLDNGRRGMGYLRETLDFANSVA